jgi:regulator of protease activity HflC (stomatin/prohibitin superfamily)
LEQQYRFRSRLPFNTVVLFVPQQEAWVTERMGKFYKTLTPVCLYTRHIIYVQTMIAIIFIQGLNFLFPVIDSIRYVQSLKEIAIEIPSQTAISKGRKNTTTVIKSLTISDIKQSYIYLSIYTLCL